MLDEILHALDQLKTRGDLPPLLRQLALRGLMADLADRVPGQGEIPFADEPAADAQPGEPLLCLAVLIVRQR